MVPPDLFLKFKWYSYDIIYSHTIIQMLICVNQYLITYQVVSCHKLIYAYFHKHIALKTLNFLFITKKENLLDRDTIICSILICYEEFCDTFTIIITLTLRFALNLFKVHFLPLFFLIIQNHFMILSHQIQNFKKVHYLITYYFIHDIEPK